MTGRHEMRDTVARALCRVGADEPCAFCTVEAGLAVVALAEGGYLRHPQTDDGEDAPAVSPEPASTSARAHWTREGDVSPASPSSPRESTLPLDVMSVAFVRSEFGSYGDASLMHERADEGYRLAGVAFGALEDAGYILTRTGDGAGASPAATSAAPLDPAAQAGETNGSPAPSSPRRFLLIRHRDLSGLTGTGVVAEGIEWTDKTATLRWHGEHPATAVWAGVEEILAIHGHKGATELAWLDQASTGQGVSA